MLSWASLVNEPITDTQTVQNTEGICTAAGGGGGQEATYGADGGDGIVLVKYTIS